MKVYLDLTWNATVAIVKNLLQVATLLASLQLVGSASPARSLASYLLRLFPAPGATVLQPKLLILQIRKVNEPSQFMLFTLFLRYCSFSQDI